MWHDVVAGLSNCLTFDHLLVVAVGTVFGLIIGALPGLSAVSGIALLLPFTFGMDPAQGLVMLAAVYMSAEYGGSITAILINTPGGAGAACTTLDGTPLTQKGQAQEALYISLLASTVGGIFGALVLIFLTQPLAKASLFLGPAETFWITIAGLTLVASLSGRNLIKGLIGTVLGIAMTLVGQDVVTGDMRFTFDDYRLVGGIPLVPAFLGLFSVASVLYLLEEPDRPVAPLILRQGVLSQVAAKLWNMKIVLLWTSCLGTLVGIIPGTGASISAFVAYAEAKRISKHPEEFGRGSWEGVAAPEAANNAVVGGSMIPLLALGIPASASAAIMFGALSVHGIIPGPRLFAERAVLAYTFMVGLFSTVFAMLIIGLLTIRWSSRLVRAPRTMMVPGIFVLSVIGAYGIANSVFDVYVLVIVGLLAYLLGKVGVPIVTIALGLVLGRLMEESYQQAAIVAEVDAGSLLLYFVMRPVAVALMFFAFLILMLGIRQSARIPVAVTVEPEPEFGPPDRGGLSMRAANLVLAAGLSTLAGFGLVEARALSDRAAAFPVLTAAALFVLAAALVAANVRGEGARIRSRTYPFQGLPWAQLALTILALVLLTAAVEPVGFYEASFIFAAVTCWLLRGGFGSSSPMLGAAKAAGFALVFMVAVYITFKVVLEVPTPHGILL
jgi:putative tricarboxylic transport membrane protein